MHVTSVLIPVKLYKIFEGCGSPVESLPKLGKETRGQLSSDDEKP